MSYKKLFPCYTNAIFTQFTFNLIDIMYGNKFRQEFVYYNQSDFRLYNFKAGLKIIETRWSTCLLWAANTLKMHFVIFSRFCYFLSLIGLHNIRCIYP